jgi:NAD(P)-dependent dehydrogenase (short-subunit alcohol dehydrogenase family)
MGRNRSGNVVVVTGGSAGIGYAMVENLLKMGNRVASLDIQEPDIVPPRDLFLIKCDVTDEERVSRSIEEILQEWDRIDILVNNAAVARYGVSDIDEVDLEMSVNFHGAVNMMRSIIPHMVSNGNGCIHNMGSMLSRAGQRGMGGYLASKAALASLTRSLSLELRESGIVMNMFYPPLTRTELTRDSGMPMDLMADPSTVGRRLARRVGSTSDEVYPDLGTWLQAQFLRIMPSFSTQIIERVPR